MRTARVFAGGIPLEVVEASTAWVDHQYAGVASGRIEPAQVGYVPTAESFRLAPIRSEALWAAVAPSVQNWLRERLERPTRLDPQCWVRRQYPPTSRPEGRFPHAWHQDGACGHDFVANPAGALVPMMTVWIPLTACGGEAPGLELVEADLDRPVALDQLADPCRDLPRWTPVMEPGDVLLMAGTVVHRTHAVETMTGTRTSLELRFVESES